ncbi:MAG TPA: GntR family transcriptional regulator [Bryobacteraceae bacterium]|jgi:DNA-binding transcriptional regulator YhcF (GntR family)
MTLRIDLNSPTPVYRQIVDSLRILLVNAELNPGDTLPPVRRLALDLGVHFNTVAEAYRTLADEAWLEIAKRSGATVIARKTPRAPVAETSATFQRRLQELVAEVQARGFAPERIARELHLAAASLKGAKS